MSETTLDAITPSVHSPDATDFLLRGAGLFYIAALVSIAGRVGITFLIAQALGATGLGVYTLAFATVQALTMLATNGQDTGLVRFASPAFHAQDRSQLRALVDAGILTTAGFAILATIAMALLFPLLASRVPNAPQLALVFGLAILPGVLSAMVGTFGLACGRNKARALPDKVIGTIVQIVLTFLALKLGWGLWGVAFAFVGNSIASLLASLVLVWDLYPRAIRAASRGAAARTLFGYSWKLGLANAAGYVLLNAALFILGFVNASQAGLYAAASRLTFPGLIFFDSFGAVFAPHAARKLHDPSLKQDLQRVTNWMIVCSAPIFILLFVFAEVWMSLLGPEFAAGAPVLRLMALAQMINMLTGGASVLIGIANRPGLKVVNTIVSWGLNLVLVLVLAPQLGALGAAYAYMTAILVIDTLEYSESRFLVHISPFGKSLIKPLLLIVGFTLGLILLSQWLTLSLWGVIALGLCFVLIYIVLMLRVGLPPADTLAVRALAQQLCLGVWR